MDPVTDKPTKIYNWGCYYENGTHECYRLFGSKAKITTYKNLKWHLIVLWYINPKMDQEGLERVSRFMCNRANGFVTFEIYDYALNNIIYDVSLYDLETPPRNRLRKIIFNEFTGLSKKEKLKIVGQIIGRSKKIHEDDIYQCMLDMNGLNKKITISSLAGLLDCSARTIHRNMSNELKQEKELLNKEL
jgi:hypothetical protein